LHNSNSFLANPRWFAEGTAMMFETISAGKASNIGAVNKNRLEEFRKLEKTGKLFDLKEFISKPDFFHAEATIGSAYAQAWALAHYLNRVKRGQIKSYIEAINKRGGDYQTTPEKEIAAFERAFGKLDDKWVKQWREWMKSVR
jgi:hypothetical protein